MRPKSEDEKDRKKQKVLLDSLIYGHEGKLQVLYDKKKYIVAFTTNIAARTMVAT